MAIPQEVTASHIRTALRHIDEHGVPPRRQATRYHLVYRAKRYPPKYVLSVAAALGTGDELNPGDFGGGDEANQFLIARGFTVVDAAGRSVVEGDTGRDATPPRSKGRTGTVAKREVAKREVAQREAPTVPGGEVAIARLALRSSWGTSPEEGGAVLQRAFSKGWPRGTTAGITITPGGLVFVRNDDPWPGTFGWDTDPRDFQAAVCRAVPLLRGVLTPTVLRAARARTRWLTLGIDMIWGDDSRPRPHVELVAVVDVERGSVVGWTGKSYPTLDQERLLIQAPPDSHFVTLNRRRVLVLGCHDLNMYNPRGFANQNAASPRRRRCTLFRRLCQEFSPSIVVQHPHTTDSPRIWQNGWAALREKLPTVQYWASGIFYDEESDPRGDLDDVLRSTRSPSGVLDLSLEGT